MAKGNPEAEQKQSLFIIRHGERLDNVDFRWLRSAARPYDPPLTEKGKEQAKAVAEYLKDKVGVKFSVRQNSRVRTSIGWHRRRNIWGGQPQTPIAPSIVVI